MASKALKLDRCGKGVCRVLEALQGVQNAITADFAKEAVLRLLDEARGCVLEIEDTVGVVTPTGLFEGGA